MDINNGQNPKMDWQARDLATAFKRFKEHSEFMFGGPLEKKSEEVKCNYLMLWAGEKGREIFSTWDVSADAKKKIQTYMDGFEAYCRPKTNLIYNRYKFKSRTQHDGETFEQFVTELRLLMRDCNYPVNMQDDLIRDHIVFGIRSNEIREKLIREGSELKLEKCIDIARTHELSQEQCKLMDEPCSVSAVKNRRQHQKPEARYTRKQPKKTTHPKTKQICDNCGQSHEKNKCPAQGVKCHFCGKLNHFVKMCRSRNQDSKPRINEVTHNSLDLVCSDFVVNAVEHDTRSNQAFVQIGIGIKTLRMKIDTGAQVNVIPSSHFASLGIKGPLQHTSKRLTAYGGKPLNVLGYRKLKCTHKDKTSHAEFYVVDSPNACPILGLETCLSLGIVNLLLSVDSNLPLDKETVLTEYADVFNGIGLLPGKSEIRIKDDAVPVVHPPRKVPVAIRDKLKTELDRMESLEIICKVTEPTEWVNSLVTVQKADGSLRLCLDPKDLNDAILRPHYPSKTIDDILPDLADAKVFSKFDARSGYWSIALTDKSSFLTTFNTPFGRYRFLRLPFGTKNSNDLFQQKMDECLENLPGVKTIVDDIVVYGKDQTSHDKHLHMFMSRCRETGIKLNSDKTQISQSDIPFFGHLLTDKGLKIDPAKVKAIKEMPSPTNKAEIETVLGMVTYLQRFAPNLSELTSPMRQLLSKDAEFRWDTPQEEAFQRVKAVITQEPGPVLTFFDPKKQVTLQVDSSKNGLGAVLLQDERPVCFASKSLTQTEVNYAQIEKELYAILFGCKRFHDYTYGRRFTVETDHKPLLAVFKKNLHSAPPRLQRMLLQLQSYDIDLTYRPGKDIPLADTLSRKYLPQTHPEFAADMDTHVHGVMSSMPVSDQKMTHIRVVTDRDEQIKLLKQVIHNGWPDDRSQCPKTLLEFWNYRDELTEVDGVILKGNKILIPKDCRTDMLKIIHESHLGVEKCTQRAREILFWPNMTTDIKATVLSCPICLEHRNANPKEPMQPSDVPDRPWQTAATDIFHWNNTDYILLVDYYSRYFEVSMLPDTRSATVIDRLKGYFSRHGIVQTLISDNARQYTSSEFAEFAKQWDFQHETSSPTYPQSNGLAERTVQTVKALFTKAKQAGKDPYLALLEYRNSPLACGKSPAQLLMSRQLRSVLPLTSDQLDPKVPNKSQIREKMYESKERSKGFYDRSAIPLKPLSTGESVRIKQGKCWKPAQVTRKVNNRSYIVYTHDGANYRRNRRHILKTNERPVNLHTPVVGKPSVQLAPETSPVPLTPCNSGASESNANAHATANDKLSSGSRSETCETKPEFYTTRSGRIVKPPAKLNL